MTTLSRKILGKNPNRAKTKGAFGSPTSDSRKQMMIERYNEAFNKKLEKMRSENEKRRRETA